MSLKNIFRKEAVEYQRARLWGEVILVQPVSYFLISGLFGIVFTLAGAFFLTQNYARKESVAGYLVPDTGIVRVYADQGGILERLYVTAGERVRKDDPIALIKLERLLTTGENAHMSVLDSIKRELIAINVRQEELLAQESMEKTALIDHIDGLVIERGDMEEEQTLFAERIVLVNRQYQAVKDLAARGHAATRLVDDQQLAVLSAQQALATSKRQMHSLDNSLTDIQNSQDQLPFRFSEQRANLSARKENLIQQISRLDQVRGYTISAPVGGTLSSVLVSEGLSLRPNLPLLTIRPNDTKLLAQLLVPSRAVGLIELEQEVKIQYEAFPYQRFGVFSGRVESISESILTFADLPTPVAMQEAFYLVQVTLESQSVTVKDREVLLKEGMILKADITLENRTLAEWLLDPLLTITAKL